MQVERFEPANARFASALMTALRERVVRVMAEQRCRETYDHDEQHQDQKPPPTDPHEPLVHTPKTRPLSVRLGSEILDGLL
jgi:hypothetical protein